MSLKKEFWKKVLTALKEKARHNPVELPSQDVFKRLKDIEGKCPQDLLAEFQDMKGSLLQVLNEMEDNGMRKTLLFYALKVLEHYVRHQRQLVLQRFFRQIDREWVSGERFSVVWRLCRKLSTEVCFFLLPTRLLARGVNEAIEYVSLCLSVGVAESVPYPLSEWVRLKPQNVGQVFVLDWLPKVVLFFVVETGNLLLTFHSPSGEVRQISIPSDWLKIKGDSVGNDMLPGSYILMLAGELKNHELQVAVQKGLKILRKVGLPCREGRLLMSVNEVEAYQVFNTPKGLLRKGIVLSG